MTVITVVPLFDSLVQVTFNRDSLAVRTNLYAKWKYCTCDFLSFTVRSGYNHVCKCITINVNFAQGRHASNAQNNMLPVHMTKQAIHHMLPSLFEAHNIKHSHFKHNFCCALFLQQLTLCPLLYPRNVLYIIDYCKVALLVMFTNARCTDLLLIIVIIGCCIPSQKLFKTWFLQLSAKTRLKPFFCNPSLSC